MTADYSPGIGGGRLRPDRRIWASLISPNPNRRLEAVETIRQQAAVVHYQRHLLEGLTSLNPAQRIMAGKSLSLLGDPRFSTPLFEPEMIHIPGGRVIIGSKAHPSEAPVHRIGVGGFSLGQFPVIEAAYHAYVRATGVTPPPHWVEGRPPPEALNCPVTNVSALEAEAYAAWLSDETGATYRLPTEAEWTMAARGPEDQRVYPWGGRFADERANVWTTRSAREVAAVGLFPAGRGPFGHAGLVGNVWEWMLSSYAPYPYNPLDGRDEPASTGLRVLRGGSFRSRPQGATCTIRMGEPASDRFAYVGFRLVREA